MKNINNIMPKIPGMRWGALTNINPTNQNIKYLDSVMPNDKKWHTILEEKNQVYIDGKTIRRRTSKSLT